MEEKCKDEKGARKVWADDEALMNPDDTERRDVEWLASRGVSETASYRFVSNSEYHNGSGYGCRTNGNEVCAVLPKAAHVQDPYSDGTLKALEKALCTYRWKYADLSRYNESSWLKEAIFRGMGNEGRIMLTVALCDDIQARYGRNAQELIAMGADVNMAVPVQWTGGAGDSMVLRTPLMCALQVFLHCRRTVCWTPFGASSHTSDGERGRNRSSGDSDRFFMFEGLLASGASPMEAVIAPVKRDMHGSKAKSIKMALYTVLDILRDGVDELVSDTLGMDIPDDMSVLRSSAALPVAIESMGRRFPEFMQLLECGCATAPNTYGTPDQLKIERFVPATIGTMLHYSRVPSLVTYARTLGLVPVNGAPFSQAELFSIMGCRLADMWRGEADHVVSRIMDAAFASGEVDVEGRAPMAGTTFSFYKKGDKSKGKGGDDDVKVRCFSGTLVSEFAGASSRGLSRQVAHSTMDAFKAYGMDVAGRRAPKFPEGATRVSSYQYDWWRSGILHAAAMFSDFDYNARYRLKAMDYVMEHGADVDARDDKGLTPLMKLVYNFGAAHSTSPSRREQLDIARRLLEHGADPNAVDDSGRDAVAILVERFKRLSNSTSMEKVRYTDSTALVSMLGEFGYSGEAKMPDGTYPEDGWQHPLALYIAAVRRAAADCRKNILGIQPPA